ncbi:MAG: J domain-containing protein [Rhodanobacteraceae bacterium]
MAGNTDFLVFYQELGLRADCSLQDFKRAYRRRVSEIHPDRDPENTVTMHGLQRLNALYANAMEFHRRHGRLPGGLPRSAAPRVSDATPVATLPTPAEPAGARQWVFVGLIVLVAAMGLWAWSDSAREDSSRAAVPAPTADAIAAPAEAAAVNLIDLGTTAERVRELNGEPVSGWEQRWEYGPSWVAFRCGLVSDWYSSRLRPLKAATEHPSPSAVWSPPKSCRE